MGAGSKIQIRGVPGVDDYEAFVTGHALWVRMVGAGGEDVNGTPQMLNGGTGDGSPIELNNSTQTVLHTVPAGSRDQVRIYASNVGDIDGFIILRFDAVVGNETQVFVPARETVAALDEHMLGPGVVLDSQLPTGSTATIRVFGDVNRFTP